jgi:hypothetical protein
MCGGSVGMNWPDTCRGTHWCWASRHQKPPQQFESWLQGFGLHDEATQAPFTQLIPDPHEFPEHCTQVPLPSQKPGLLRHDVFAAMNG